MSISTTKTFSCAGCRQKPADIIKVGAIKYYLGTGAESSGRMYNQSMQTLQVLSMCLLDFWESRGKLCAKEPATHPIFYHNTSSQSSWFFYICHTSDFLGCFCHRDTHQAENNRRPSHAFFTCGLTRIWNQDFREEIHHTKLNSKCKLDLGELEFSSFITAWASQAPSYPETKMARQWGHQFTKPYVCSRFRLDTTPMALE